MTNSTPGPHPARQMLEQVGRDLPGIWAQHAEWMTQARARSPWPNWCYAPLAAVAPIFDRPLLAAKVTALATWRMTQGIYRVDPTLRDALVSTPLDGAIPFEVLLRMPEWCVYIELPPLQTLRGIARGVWAWVEPGREEGAAVLCMLFDTERELASSMRDDSMFLACIQLRGASLAAALEATFPAGEDVHGWFRRAAEPVLSILLYICSQDAEFTRAGVPDRPSLPTPVRTRRTGLRLYPAAQSVYWDLGVRMGSALRAAMGAAPTEEGTERARVTPHVRRAHWHTFLSGPIKNVQAGQRRRDVRWMPPIPVNVTDAGELLSTIKPRG